MHLLKETVTRPYATGKSPLEPATIIGKDNLDFYQRTKGEQIAAMLTGRTPINEVATKRAKYQMDYIRKAQEEARAKAANILLDKQLGRQGIQEPA